MPYEYLTFFQSIWRSWNVDPWNHLVKSPYRINRPEAKDAEGQTTSPELQNKLSPYLDTYDFDDVLRFLINCFTITVGYLCDVKLISVIPDSKGSTMQMPMNPVWPTINQRFNFLKYPPLIDATEISRNHALTIASISKISILLSYWVKWSLN